MRILENTNGFLYFSVEIGRIGLGRTLFTNFESNVWKNYTKTVFRSSRNEKSSLFSIRCAFYFIANAYITLNKTRNLFASIKFCSESTVVTGVGPVSPASTLDRVMDKIDNNTIISRDLRTPGQWPISDNKISLKLLNKLCLLMIYNLM